MYDIPSEVIEEQQQSSPKPPPLPPPIIDPSMLCQQKFNSQSPQDIDMISII